MTMINKNIFFNINALNIPLIGYIASNGFSIPHYCYHENLSISGNCRMCVIELSAVPKPVVFCAYNTFVALEKNDFFSHDSVLVKKARENIMEFFFLNHPLDCPVCDQGGDYDLQNQALYFNTFEKRFYFFKYAVSNTNIVIYVKTLLTKCIHCTRCVRFAFGIIGFNELGKLGRGPTSQFRTSINATVQSITMENMIDLCPVGSRSKIVSSGFNQLSQSVAQIKAIAVDNLIKQLTPGEKSAILWQAKLDSFRGNIIGRKPLLFSNFTACLLVNKYFKGKFFFGWSALGALALVTAISFIAVFLLISNDELLRIEATLHLEQPEKSIFPSRFFSNGSGGWPKSSGDGSNSYLATSTDSKDISCSKYLETQDTIFDTTFMDLDMGMDIFPGMYPAIFDMIRMTLFAFHHQETLTLTWEQIVMNLEKPLPTFTLEIPEAPFEPVNTATINDLKEKPDTLNQNIYIVCGVVLLAVILLGVYHQ